MAYLYCLLQKDVYNFGFWFNFTKCIFAENLIAPQHPGRISRMNLLKVGVVEKVSFLQLL